jgi:hypothetical protein
MRKWPGRVIEAAGLSRTVSQVDKGAYDNLILLCTNCHTTIDKAPADYPDNMIREWKRKHVERINSLFSAVEYPDRAAARKAIEPALTEKRSVFNTDQTTIIAKTLRAKWRRLRWGRGVTAFRAGAGDEPPGWRPRSARLYPARLRGDAAGARRGRRSRARN